MNKKYLSLGLAAAVLVALFAMALHDPLRFPVINRVVTAVITPFAAASSAVGGWVDDTGEAMTTVKTLQQQNESLQSEINELRYANLAMAEIYAENQRLREMLNYKNAHPEQRFVVSKVLGRTPGELSDSLYIDKGTDDGVQQALDQIENSDMKRDRVLVIYLPDCHESLAGIIAGRIRERYYRPVFVLTRSQDGVKGSGRSIETYSMFEEMSKCKELYTKYGGHPMAAGLSLAISDIDIFRKMLMIMRYLQMRI